MSHSDETVQDVELTPEHVLAFWFDEIGPDGWFTLGRKLDERVVERFQALHASAATGGVDMWAQTPRGLLALVIVLDQFSRHIHRDAPAAFATDARALALSKTAIERGDEQHFDAEARKFLYLPFEHSEQLSDQERSLQLFGSLGVPPENMKFILRHHEIIARFGRFPHRNAVLGRTTTEQEAVFLLEPNSSF